MLNLDSTFGALADPTRRAILARLCQGEATALELAAPFDISQPAVSRHLLVLERAGLIVTRVQGSKRPRRLAPGALEGISEWLELLKSAMERNYDRLDTILNTKKMAAKTPGLKHE